MKRNLMFFSEQCQLEPSHRATQEYQEEIERVDQKQFSSEFPYMYLNEPVSCPFHVKMFPQWQKHAYGWAVPALQSRLGHS